MVKFLTIHSTYTTVEIALFEDTCKKTHTVLDHKKASQLLMLTIAESLAVQDTTLKNLDFIAAHQGPGPFTTLRVVMASVNGLAFATHIPLIGVDGFDALMREYSNSLTGITVLLLQAFSNDVYYALVDSQKNTVRKGACNSALLLDTLKTDYATEPMYFLGNGASLYRDSIVHLFGERAHIDTSLEQCSLDAVSMLAYEKWKKGGFVASELMPLYFKNHPVVLCEKSLTLS